MTTQFPYTGPLKAVILDWAGTVVDFGSFAPTLTFLKLFSEKGITITTEQVRKHMGLKKRDHLKAILFSEDVSVQWQAQQGALPTEADVDALYEEFLPLQIKTAVERAEPISGALDAIAAFRERGMKIGSNTGYTRAIMDEVEKAAAEYGYKPDACLGSDEVSAGRPAPWMAYKIAEQFGIYPMHAIVKIGDTPVDIEEGHNAGMWTIGLAMSGNSLGLTAEQVEMLSPEQAAAERDRITAMFKGVNAHYVVDSLADVPSILDQIEERLKNGEKP